MKKDTADTGKFVRTGPKRPSFFHRFPDNYTLIFILATLFYGCSVTRTLPEDSFLYTGSKLELKNPDSVSVKELRPELESLFSPRTNSKLLGYPFRLHLYNLFASEKEKGLFPWLQKSLGEPPVLYEEQIPKTVMPLMTNRAFNMGYFNSSVESRLDTLNNQKVKLVYQMTVEQPYLIQDYEIRIDHPRINRNLTDLPPSEILKPGNRYSLNDLKRERQRIADWLQQKGYFYFDDNYLRFVGDSIPGNRQIKLVLLLKEDIPGSDLKPMYIDDITIYPDFSMSKATKAPSQKMTMDSITFLYDEMPVRPKSILRTILPQKGGRYDRDLNQRTRERLLNRDFFQFVNIRYSRSQKADSLLDMVVFLTPRKPNTIEGSLGVSHKSTGFIGPEASLSFANRNLFGGAERLDIFSRINLNYPLSERVTRYYEELELGARLTRPGLLVPFLSDRTKRMLIDAGTTFTAQLKREKGRFPLDTDSTSVEDIIADLEELGFVSLPEKLRADSTYAPFIGVNELKFTFGYIWKARRSIIHEFNPLNFRFQIGFYEDPELEILFVLGSILTNRLENILSLQRMFIYQPEYIFTYDSRLEKFKRHNYFFQGRTSYSGNEVLPTNNDLVDFGNLESQYLQLETDWRYFLMTSRKNTYAFRFIANMSLPLAEELILPFFDFYTVGGPNSIRAFGTRQIGPGTVDPSIQRSSLLAGKGNIQLEASAEYRRKVSTYFELAAFLDVGNVWLFENQGDDETGEADFQWSEFYKEFAVGTGLGLRLNLSSLIIRLDWGIPLAKPWLDKGKRWVGNQIELFSGSWRKNNLQWNFAFGYPF